MRNKFFETLVEAYEFIDRISDRYEYQVIRWGNCVEVKIW